MKLQDRLDRARRRCRPGAKANRRTDDLGSGRPDRGKGAKRGALVGAVIGVVLPPALLATTTLEAAAGAIAGRVTDQGFSNRMLQDLAKRVEPGESAILAASEPPLYDEIMAVIDDYEELHERTLETDDSGVLILPE